MTDDELVLDVVAEETGATDGIPRWRLLALEATATVIAITPAWVTIVVLMHRFDLTSQTLALLTVFSGLAILVLSDRVGEPERRVANTIWLTPSERHVHDHDAISIPRPREVLR